MIHFECESRPFVSLTLAEKESEFNQNFNYGNVNEWNMFYAIFSSLHMLESVLLSNNKKVFSPA